MGGFPLAGGQSENCWNIFASLGTALFVKFLVLYQGRLLLISNSSSFLRSFSILRKLLSEAQLKSQHMAFE